MAENRHEPNQPYDLSRPELRHEHADVDTWAIGKFGIGLVFLTLISLVLLAGLFKFFASLDGGKPAVRVVHAPKLPPQPNLETTPVEDLRDFRNQEDLALHNYGWVDQSKGVVRIPLDRAIDLLVQRGLPSRPPTATPDSATQVSVPTESGLGPKVQVPGGPLAAAGESK